MQRYFHTLAFDLDGTLTDPYRGLTSGFRYAFRKMGIDYGSDEVLKTFIGPPIRQEWMRLYGLTADGAEEAVFYFREYFGVYGWWDNELYTGIQELLRDLKHDGRKIVLATSKPDIYSRKILERFSLSQYFDFSEGASFDTSRDKKCDVLRYALQNVGIGEKDLSGVAMIGDTQYDVEGARKVGVSSIGVTYGYGKERDLKAAGADYLAKSVEELRKILL